MDIYRAAKRRGKYPSLSPTLRRIMVLVFIVANLNVFLCVASDREFNKTHICVHSGFILGTHETIRAWTTSLTFLSAMSCSLNLSNSVLVFLVYDHMYIHDEICISAPLD